MARTEGSFLIVLMTKANLPYSIVQIKVMMILLTLFVPKNKVLKKHQCQEFYP